MKKEKQICYIVPEAWFKSLLQLAKDFDDNVESYEYGNHKNDKMFMRAMAVTGYARSAKYILESNEKIER